MQKAFIFLIVIALLLLPAVSLSCAGNIKAVLGETFTLPIGQTVDIAGEDLSIQFLKVIEDNRCPTGMQCISMGQANCRMLMIYPDTSHEILLIQPGGNAASYDYFKYMIYFKLEPYPEGGKKIAPSDYKLIMTITRKY